MKILLTVPTFPPFNSGLGNATYDLANHLSEQHHVQIATQRIDARDHNYDYHVREFDLSGSLTLRSPITGDIDSFLDFVRNNSFDLIICVAWHTWSTEIILQNAKDISAKIVLYSHGESSLLFFHEKPFRSFIRLINYLPYWLKRRNLFNAIDHFVFLNHGNDPMRFSDLKYVKRRGLPYSIAPNLYPQSIEDEAKVANPDLLISVGSFAWEKGFDRVIKAYARSTLCNKMALHLFGQQDTVFLRKLQKLANDLKILPEYIHFHVGLNREELTPFYKQAKVLLNGSRTEVQPLVILDAHKSGTPFISFDVGDVSLRKSGCSVKSIKHMTTLINNLEPVEKLSVFCKYDLTYHSSEYSNLVWGNVFNAVNLRSYTSI